MDPIDIASSALAAAIRRQVASLRRARGTAPASTGAQHGSTPAGARADRDATQDIAALIARRVEAIDPDDPERHRKAFRVFLQSVLLAELGENLVNDAGFHQLVEEVHCDMEADDELAPVIRAATTRLLAPSERSRRT